MNRFILAAALSLSAACASTPAAPTRPRWTLSVDSKPAGAVMYGNHAQPDGRISFQPFGTTPLSMAWEQGFDDEFIKLTSGTQSVTIIPAPGQPVYVDFTTDPITVLGAKLMGR